MEHKPEDWIGCWINKVERAINNIHDKKLQQYDLTVSQVLVLHQLWNKDGLTQKEIQKNLNLRPASVSGLVDMLLRKGFIDRKQDDQDARFKRLYLTEEGRRLKDLSLEVIKEIEHIISQGFSEEEKVIFILWMRKLYNNLNALEK
ncbi:MarR family transcriptional regulator [Clostridium polyendosporum]|uniref:MarR family transcriptional regulator n=1 Tax=Clostridium polyendosporum TaxID=69208 RepID=A0A919S2Q0_9CLOT|nr:MarR family transcriptional regulator [Clostridium polyendosporum]GIM29498.1 MarR family transcriptional regulator [Clostridium polyendosporum]